MDDSHSENNVNHICECLKTTELENEEIVVDFSSVDEVVNRGKTCLLIKLLTTKYYNCEAFKNTMRKVWRPVKALQFYEMGGGLMMVEFEPLSNKLRVVQDDPWSFDKSLILVGDFDGL